LILIRAEADWMLDDEAATWRNASGMIV